MTPVFFANLLPKLDRRKLFHGAWLALGLVQAAALSGCAASDAGDSLFSSGPPQSQTQTQSRSAAPSSAAPAYVRIPRGFFGGRLEAALSVRAPSGAEDVSVRSAARWTEVPLELPPPPMGQPEPIAVFHDSQGCLAVADAGDAGVCFEVMGDVDSVGLNPREMRPEGLSPWLDAQKALGAAPGCQAPWELALTDARREAGGFSVTYEARHCGEGPYRVDLTVKSL